AVASNNYGARYITTEFGCNTVFYQSQAVINLEDIGKQITESLGFPPNTFTIQSGSTEIGTLKNRKKRLTASAPTCGANNRLVLTIVVNNCPHSTCKTEHCFDQCASQIKSSIQSKLSTTLSSLVIVTADRTTMNILAIFCSFQQPTPGNRCF
ncbi:unnamed protein product, partial [Adineta ricciae]